MATKNTTQSTAREAGQTNLNYLTLSKRVNIRTVAALQRALDNEFRKRLVTVQKGKHPFEIAFATDCSERSTFAVGFVAGWMQCRGF